MVNVIVKAITSNEKRMAKLNTLTGQKRREQARGYVVAECQKQKVRLNADEITLCAVRIAG